MTNKKYINDLKDPEGKLGKVIQANTTGKFLIKESGSTHLEIAGQLGGEITTLSSNGIKIPSSEEDLRPDVDCEGNEISNGDLIEIISRGIVFHAYVDDSLDEQARPARQKDVDNESWFNALDWDTSRLIEKAKT